MAVKIETYSGKDEALTADGLWLAGLLWKWCARMVKGELSEWITKDWPNA